MVSANVPKAADVPAEPLELLPGGAVVAVAMSGGVDSSLAAARCVAAGVRTFGITLAMWPRATAGARDRGCCSVEAVDDARRVARTLGIPHYPWNLESEFDAAVVRPFEEAYAGARTPNPCVSCNQRIKFGALMERARAAGATHLATGHYARVGRRGGVATLHRARATEKDQAYQLHRVGQAALLASVFPLGAHSSKQAVRAEALRLGLATAHKADSQELCFVEDTLIGELRRRLAGRFAPGPVIDVAGAVLGEHRGLPFYTVGQRRGLGIAAATPDASPRYVIALDPVSNALVVGGPEQLLVTRISASDCRWVGGDPVVTRERCQVQLRAHSQPLAATVEAADPISVVVVLDVPAPRTAPGQSVVLYRDDEVLGGGVLEAVA